MKILIVDDEMNNRILLSAMLEKIKFVSACETAHSALEAVKKIHESTPDVVLLDIEMPGGSGLELLESFPNRKFEVVFITAHEKYALQAIKRKTHDYLLKPVNQKELADTLASLLNGIDSSESSSIISDKITINTLEETYFIKVTDILRVSSAGNYCIYHLINGNEIAASHILKKAQESLPSSLFFRTHNSHLINLNFVQKLDKTEGDIIIMIDGAEVPLSRRRKDEFLVAVSE